MKRSGTTRQTMDNQSLYPKYTIDSSGTHRVPSEEKSRSTDMLVLGGLCDGAKNFETLHKKLRIDNETLNSVLGDLEKQGLIRIENKQGFFGPKIELYPTKEGIKKYHS